MLHLTSSEIIVYSDIKKLINEVYWEVEKESQCEREAETIVKGIQDKIEKSTIDISLKHSNTKCRENRIFQHQPEPRLMKECDKRLKEF